MEQSKESIDLKHRKQNQSVLSSEVSQLLKGLKKVRKSKFIFWEEVVGEKIAKVAVPVKNKNGVLFVKVDDAVWRFELSRRKEELLDKIFKYYKKNVIKEIVFI